MERPDGVAFNPVEGEDKIALADPARQRGAGLEGTDFGHPARNGRDVSVTEEVVDGELAIEAFLGDILVQPCKPCGFTRTVKTGRIEPMLIE